MKNIIKRIIPFFIFVVFTISYRPIFALPSSIVDADGYACMGEDRTKRQTEEAALQDAKKKAIEQVSTYIKAETQVKDFAVQKDIVNAYTNARVRIMDEKGKWDSEPPKVGDCYRKKIRAEVIPDEEAMKVISQAQVLDDPLAPLKVQVWTEKREYRSGERIKVYMKGNKPFYARLIYRQADGSLIQILPNPYRKENYFQGGVLYEIPSGPDRFDLEVTPPFGEESIVVYASTAALGDIAIEEAGAVYMIKTGLNDIGEKTRGLKIVEKDKKSNAQEFIEEKITIKTH